MPAPEGAAVDPGPDRGTETVVGVDLAARTGVPALVRDRAATDLVQTHGVVRHPRMTTAMIADLARRKDPPRIRTARPRIVTALPRKGTAHGPRTARGPRTVLDRGSVLTRRSARVHGTVTDLASGSAQGTEMLPWIVTGALLVIVEGTLKIAMGAVAREKVPATTEFPDIRSKRTKRESEVSEDSAEFE